MTQLAHRMNLKDISAMEATGSLSSRELRYVMKINNWSRKELAEHCGLSVEEIDHMRNVEANPEVIAEARRLSRRKFNGIQLRIRISQELYEKLKATGNISEAIRDSIKQFLESRDNSNTTNHNT